MHPLAVVKKSEKFKSGLVPILISFRDFIISYCHVYIKGSVSIPKCKKVVISDIYKQRLPKKWPQTGQKRREMNNFQDRDAPSSVDRKERQIQIKASANTALEPEGRWCSQKREPPKEMSATRIKTRHDVVVIFGQRLLLLQHHCSDSRQYSRSRQKI